MTQKLRKQIGMENIQKKIHSRGVSMVQIWSMVRLEIINKIYTCSVNKLNFE